jgi:tetratricopeptide (TPR) repeat protein/CHAT domain-containing protein
VGLFDWMRRSSRKSVPELWEEVRTLAAASRWDEARRHFKRISTQAHTVDMRLELARIAVSLKKDWIALEFVNEILERDPGNPSALSMRIELLRRQAPPEVPHYPDQEAANKKLAEMSAKVLSLFELGRFVDAIPIAQHAVDFARTHVGESSPSFATSLNNLAELYRETGDYATALSLCERACETRLAGLGKEHPDYATSLNSLAGLYRDLGNHAAALPLYRQALDVRRTVLGTGDPDYAISLNNLAELYQATGAYTAALPLYQQAREILSDGHPHYTAVLNNLAGLHWAMGDHSAALPLYQRACEIFRATLGEGHPSYAISLDNLAALLGAMGTFKSALGLHTKACEITRVALGEEHPDYATSLNNLAGLYGAMGNNEAALPLHLQALEVRRKALGDAHPKYATSLSNLAGVYQAMGDHAAALPLYQRASEILLASLGEGHRDYATSLNNLAECYHNLGDHTLALRLYMQARAARRAMLGEGHPDYAFSLNNLAELYRAMGDHAAALPLYRQASDILRAAFGANHPNYAASLNNLAELYRAMGDQASALPLLQQAGDIIRASLGEGHPDHAVTVSNLAGLYSAMGYHETALDLYQHARDIVAAALGERHPRHAAILSNLAGSYWAIGGHTAALPLYQQACEITRTALGEAHPQHATSLNNLAVLYHALGDRDSALKHHQQALDIRRTALGENHPDYAQSLKNLADLYAATGRIPEAIALTVQAAHIEEQFVGQIFSFGSERQRDAILERVRYTLDLLLSLVTSDPMTPREAVLQALDAVLRRKGLGAEALATQRLGILRGKHPHLEHKLREHTALSRQIAQATYAGPGAEGIAAHRALLTAWTARKDRLESELAGQIPEMKLERRPSAANRCAVASALPEGAVLAEFVRFEFIDFQADAAREEKSRYLAFLLPAGAPDDVRMIDLGDANRINGAIDRFRANLIAAGRDLTWSSDWGSQANSAADLTAGRAARQAVFDPLGLAPRVHARLVVAPDGDLTRLPFGVLPNDDGTLIGDDYLVSYVTSGRDVLRFGAEPAGRRAPAIVVADPDFDYGGGTARPESSGAHSSGRRSRDIGRLAFPIRRLPGTRKEGIEVAALLRITPWLDAKALEGRIKSECRSPSILHLATHGFFLEDQHDEKRRWLRTLGFRVGDLSDVEAKVFGSVGENPMLRSGLILAGVNHWHATKQPLPEAEDGLLLAEDVAGLELVDTELVVLSACDTGLGEVRTGDGVYGLQRAFVAAGAKALIMSLWKVPDEPTRELMAHFYQCLLVNRQGKAEALHNAQIAMKAKYSCPSYWGAFVCLGDPGPLSRSDDSLINPSRVSEPP